MKYVRTKNYVFRVAEDIMLATSPMRYAVLDKKEDIRIGSICVNDAIAQSDTIEELCDEFVVIRDNQRPIPLINLEQVRLNRGNYGYSNSKVYGAIWTEKGLIYVAKMNEEGVLCLI